MKTCITFAGCVGSSKTPIAHVLSAGLCLPIFSNDAIRTEVTEDLGVFDQEVYVGRRNERLEELMSKGTSFIFDASVDREWKKLKEYLVKYDYRWFIVSLDLSKELLVRLYRAKGYDASMDRLDQLLVDHSSFLSEHENEVGVHINDSDFPNRTKLALDAASNWL